MVAGHFLFWPPLKLGVTSRHGRSHRRQGQQSGSHRRKHEAVASACALNDLTTDSEHELVGDLVLSVPESCTTRSKFASGRFVGRSF